MDLAAVFALSLLGGYFFAAWWRLTSYATRRYEGHHLYFRAALCGVIFFALALLLRTQVLSHVPVLKGWDDKLIDYVKAALKEEPDEPQAIESRRAEWLATALYSLALAPLTAWLLNRCTPVLWAQRRTVRQQLNLPDDWTRQFQIVIRAQSIITANSFSTAVYAKFNPDWKQRIAHQMQKPPPQELTVQIKEPRVPPWRRAPRGPSPG